MRKLVLLLTSGGAILTTLTMIWIIFYGASPLLSNRKTIGLKIIDTITERYHLEILSLEDKVYASIHQEEVQQFLKDIKRNPKKRYTISFADPFLINLLLVNKENIVSYAYTPLNIPVKDLPYLSGITLINQETLAITTLLPENVAEERLVFIYNLRLLFKTLFNQSIEQFSESHLKVYRFAFVYNLEASSSEETALGEIETLVDASYEHDSTIVYEAATAKPSKLIGRKLSNGLLIGIFYENAYGNIPLLSWVILSACFLVSLLSIAQLTLTDTQKSLMPFRLRFSLWNHEKPSSLPEDLVTPQKKENLGKLIPQPVQTQDTGIKQKAYPEIVSLVEAISNEKQNGTEQDPKTSKPSHLPSTPTENKLSRNYRSVILKLKPHAKEFLSPKNNSPNRIPTLQSLTGTTWSCVLILERVSFHLPFTLSEFQGMDFQTASQLIITEKEKIYTRFLGHGKALFIGAAQKDFFAPRLDATRLTHLAHIKSLLILPFKPPKNKHIKTILLFG